MKKKSTTYVDYQARSSQVSPGDMAYPYHAKNHHAGRVVAVYPAIGMVDIEFPHGSKRYPVEDIQVVDSDDFWLNAPHTDSVPGGAGQVSVPGGPYERPDPKKYLDYENEAYHKSIAEEKAEEKRKKQTKKALYWNQPNRKYRPTKSEIESGYYTCPRCKSEILKKCVYKRDQGISEKLLGCPSCMFLIKRCDVVGCGG